MKRELSVISCNQIVSSYRVQITKQSCLPTSLLILRLVERLLVGDAVVASAAVVVALLL